MSIHHHARSAAWEHPVDLSQRWANESLFGRLSRIGLRHPTTDELFNRELRGCSLAANPLTLAFSLSKMRGHESVDQLRQFVGEAGHQGLDRLIGSDMLQLPEALSSSSSTQRFLRPVLRYCPQCLQRGYHSMLFQHLGVVRCPGHGVALREGCPHCKAPVEPKLRSALVKPFECRKCASLMVKTVLPPEARDEQRRVDDLIGDWRRDLTVQHHLGESRESCPALLGTETDEPLHQRQRWRRYQRILAWPQFETTRWTRFRQLERELPESDLPAPPHLSGSSPYGNVIVAEATGVLAWLVRACGAEHAGESHALIQGAWLRMAPDDLRGFSAVPMALHMTMCQYATAFEPSVQLGTVQTITPYQGVSWNGHSAQALPTAAREHAAILLVHEILGFFVCSLLSCAGRNPRFNARTYLSAERLSPEAFCPSWKIQREGREFKLRVRPRADHVFTQRLLRRYATTPLRRAVQCHNRPSVDPGVPRNYYTRWAQRVPLELLHFPAGEPCAAGLARQSWEDMRNVLIPPVNTRSSSRHERRTWNETATHPIPRGQAEKSR